MGTGFECSSVKMGLRPILPQSYERASTKKDSSALSFVRRRINQGSYET
jgi:hypothetical protein